VRRVGRRAADGAQQVRIELGHRRQLVVEDRRSVGDDAVGRGERALVVARKDVGERTCGGRC
jgi:uncharacterized membrane-anchored protein